MGQAAWLILARRIKRVSISNGTSRASEMRGRSISGINEVQVRSSPFTKLSRPASSMTVSAAALRGLLTTGCVRSGLYAIHRKVICESDPGFRSKYRH